MSKRELLQLHLKHSGLTFLFSMVGTFIIAELSMGKSDPGFEEGQAIALGIAVCMVMMFCVNVLSLSKLITLNAVIRNSTGLSGLCFFLLPTVFVTGMSLVIYLGSTNPQEMITATGVISFLAALATFFVPHAYFFLAMRKIEAEESVTGSKQS